MFSLLNVRKKLFYLFSTHSVVTHKLPNNGLLNRFRYIKNNTMPMTASNKINMKSPQKNSSALLKERYITPYRFLAPSEVTKLRTQRHKPSAKEIPAKHTIKMPITDNACVSPSVTRKIELAKSLKPAPTPSATPLI